MEEFGIWQIVHSLDLYVPVFLKLAHINLVSTQLAKLDSHVLFGV